MTCALVMIVRNEERCLSRALAGVDGIVDDVVVLDTGSTDRTVEIAREHGARVFSHEWTDDFAAARNAALDHADSDWNLVLDADEWLAEGGAILRRVAATPATFVGDVTVASSFDLDGRLETAVDVVSRLLPRPVRYAGAVHEQPVHDLPKRRLDVLIRHDGYQPTQRQAKRGRNERLVRAALAAHPEDGYLHFQLGRELETQDRFAEAAASYRRARRLTGPQDRWRHELVVRSVYVLKRAAWFEEAVALADEELARWPDSPDLAFALGDLFLDLALAQPDRSAELLPMVESAWLRCLHIGERPGLSGTVAGRGSFLAAHNLAGVYEALGEAEQARRYRRMSSRMRAEAGRDLVTLNPTQR